MPYCEGELKLNNEQILSQAVNLIIKHRMANWISKVVV